MPAGQIIAGGRQRLIHRKRPAFGFGYVRHLAQQAAILSVYVESRSGLQYNIV
jgi:hypothetical protein